MAAVLSNPTLLKHGLTILNPQLQSPLLYRNPQSSVAFARSFRRNFIASSSSSSFANDNREYVIVGGGNAAGYAARTFVDHGMADGKLCIVSKEAYAPYERPALSKAYLHPSDKKPARLPGFHTCVGSGGEKQTPDWYKEQGIEMFYEDPVTDIDIEKHVLTTKSGNLLKYGSLIIATGCGSTRFPDKIGGNLHGVHYIRDVADANSLISSMEKARKIVIVGGGYIGMEVAAAAVGWKLDTTMIFPGEHLLPRLFTSSLAQKYEKLYQANGVNIIKGASVARLEADSNGHVAAVRLENGSVLDTDMVVVGIGAKPAVSPFDEVGLNKEVGGIQVDGQFRTSIPGVFAIGDVAAFPLKIYNRMARVEHVDHARKSARHCIESLLTAKTHPYDYLPYFYSRVFEYEGSPRKVWWQFFGDNVGEAIEIGNFDPKVAVFWVDSGKLKGILLESGTAEALTRIRLESMVDEKIHGPEPEQFIHIVPDKKNGSLSIIDSGIGMTSYELKRHLGDHPEHRWIFSETVNMFASDPDADISCLYLPDSGFSLGFHSAYMVADKVVVTTKRSGDDQYVWESNGFDSYTIARDTSGERFRLGRGTKVTLFLNNNHLKYADEHILNDLIKKYVERLTYPIHILVDDGKTKKQIVDDEKQKVEPLPIETLRVKFEGLRKKFVKYIGYRVEKIVVSDRIFDLPRNLSTDRKTFEINPRSPIMEELRQMADDKDFDEEEMRELILGEFQRCIYNIRGYDRRHGTSYVKTLSVDQVCCPLVVDLLF